MPLECTNFSDIHGYIAIWCNLDHLLHGSLEIGIRHTYYTCEALCLGSRRLCSKFCPLFYSPNLIFFPIILSDATYYSQKFSFTLIGWACLNMHKYVLTRKSMFKTNNRLIACTCLNIHKQVLTRKSMF